MREYFSINKEFKKFLPIFLIMLSVLLLIGTSYALLRSSQVGENTYVMKVGLLEVTFVDSKTNALTIENVVPMTDSEGMKQTNELAFTVKNTGDYTASYDVYMEETSTSPEFKTMIRFISNKNDTGYNSPKTLSEDKYIDQRSVLQVAEEATYKVKAWLKEDADSTYMDKTFTARIVVVASQMPSGDTFVNIIKGTLGQDKGVVAINTEGALYDSNDTTQTIREYRYSGTSVNNYVTYNNETWRIIGVFSETLENGTTEEYIKIVRDAILPAGSMPTSYYVASQPNTYTVGYSTTSSNAYWNKPASLKSTNYNDWTTGGLRYYLNTEQDDSATPNAGYLSTLTAGAKKLIRESIYYLGNYKYNTDTAITGYASERSSTIYTGNQATWKGKVALIYPSDYGYSVDSSYWNSVIYNWSKVESDGVYARSTSWLYSNAAHKSYEWLLSPSSSNTNSAIYWSTTGNVGYDLVSDYLDIRPCLGLIPSAKVAEDGDGSQGNPYVVQES